MAETLGRSGSQVFPSGHPEILPESRERAETQDGSEPVRNPENPASREEDGRSRPAFSPAVQVTLADGSAMVVSRRDADLVDRHRWHRDGKGYAVRNAPKVGGVRQGPKIRLHVEIMRPPAGMQVDHINGDKLDNRRENLRVVTNQQNSYNQGARAGASRYKGVCWNRKAGKWQASIRVSDRRIHLGIFSDEIAAAQAYDAAAVKHHGEFARLNFGRHDG